MLMVNSFLKKNNNNIYVCVCINDLITQIWADVKILAHAHGAACSLCPYFSKLHLVAISLNYYPHSKRKYSLFLEHI